MLNRILYVLLILTVASSCNESGNSRRSTADSVQNKVQRFGMVTGLKPEKVAVYKSLHAHVWPMVLKQIKESNIRNYSIYLKEINGKPYLFSYFEYTGNDFSADMRKMAADSVTKEWWKQTDPTQLPLPDAQSKKQVWSSMEEVFHMQ